MPKGPKGEKRPADVVGNAVKIMRIAIGEEEDVVALIDVLAAKVICNVVYKTRISN